MSYLLEANGIVKDYTGHKALDDVTVHVPEGSVYGLLGPNGAGKTTLIRIINHITAPDAGEVIFDGRPLTADDVKHIGYLPEERGLYKKMKVGEQAIFFARLKGLDKRDAEKRLKEWFERMEIGNWWNKKVEELSKGMAQKVQFITTVLHQPEMLIFDEPFSGFDPINVELLKKEILELRQKGTTIIFSTHNMSSVEEICSHIALINKSHKIIEGPINEIREKYANNSYQLSIRPNDEIDVEELAGKEFEVLSNRTEGIRQDIVLQKLTDCPTNTLLSRFIGHTDILSYDKIIPSMHDIFIKLVKEQ